MTPWPTASSPQRLPAFLADWIATRESWPPYSFSDDSAEWPRERTVAAAGDPAIDSPAALIPPTDTSRDGGQRSLFGEILDWMMVPLLLLWPLSVAITFVIARSIADAPFDQALEAGVRALAQQVQFVDGSARLNTPSARDDATVSALSATPAYRQVLDTDGFTLLGPSDLPRPALYDYPETGVVKLRQDTYRGVEVRIAYQYVGPTGNELPDAPVLVQVADTSSGRTQLANEIIKGLILPQFLILPLALALVWYGLGRGLRPLRQVQERIHLRSPDDLSPLDRRSVPQEIAPLVDGFNELLARLGSNVREQRRFIANAAHQMKTPLAGLRTQAELALRETDPAEVRRSLEQLAHSSGRAAHLISQLLAMARIENLRDRAAFEHLDLNPLARMVMTDWADRALQRSIDFGFETDDVPAPIAGHPLLLHELLANLIDNALRYTPSGGEVTVRVGTGAEDVRLEIEDDGPGIPEAEHALVFEPFYRVLGTTADGSGLGLSIVKEIAARHDALVTLRDARPGNRPLGNAGTRVIVQFPKLREG